MVGYLPLPPIFLIILDCCGLPLLLGVAAPCCLEVQSPQHPPVVDFLWSLNVSADHYKYKNTFRQNLMANLLQ